MSFGTSVYMFYTPVLGPSKAVFIIFSVPFIAMALKYIYLNEPFTFKYNYLRINYLYAIFIMNKRYKKW